MKNFFVVPPKPEMIKNPRDLCKNANRILQIYEDRALINRLGDTKIYDDNVAKLLKITRKTVYNCKKKLIDAGLISVHQMRVLNGKGQFRTIQTIRCWRVMYRFKFSPEKKNTWLTCKHPPIDMEKSKKIIPLKFFSSKKENNLEELWGVPESFDFTKLFSIKPDQEWQLPFQLASISPCLWDGNIDTRLCINEELQQTFANGEDKEIKMRLGLTDECRMSKNRWYREIMEYKADISRYFTDQDVISRMVTEYSKKRNQRDWLYNVWYSK
jgi:hypothetical protein